jgi:hypothetical protein
VIEDESAWPEHIARVAVSGNELWRLGQWSDTMVAVRRDGDCCDYLGEGEAVLIATRDTWRRVCHELDCWVIANGSREPVERERVRAMCAAIRRGVLGEGGSGS